MDGCLQDAKSFLKREQATIQFLSSKHSSPGLINIARAAEQARHQVNLTRGANVYLSWPAGHDSSKRKIHVHVGGRVQCENNVIVDISYFMALTADHGSGGQDKRQVVLRKYHFDYTNPKNRRRSPHPVFHLHLTGKLPPEMPSTQYVIDHLYPDLSEPRILYLPMSLALVLHTIFSEFREPDTEKIRNDSDWHAHVKRDQEILWHAYMHKCLEYIGNKDILHDRAYAQATI